MASPDRNDCITESLSFTTGTDLVGKYVSFTVPELKYWDMIYYKYGTESEPSLYEAESSILAGVSTNTNHAGYTGTGFVDGYGDLYDSVTFDIEVATEDDYTLEFTYANATAAECMRQLSINN
jgi:dextranase